MFKVMQTVLDKNKTPSDKEINKISSFVFTRWLQNHPDTILLANKINQYYNIPIINQYYLIKNSLSPKKYYIKYPKVQNEISKIDEILARHFNIGIGIVGDYKQFMTKSEIDEIIEDYERLNK